MRLIEHVGRAEGGQAVELRVYQFVKDQEKLKRLDRTRIQIVVSVFAVVEVKTRKLAELISRETIISMLTLGA